MKVISVCNVSKQFKTPKKFPGFKGALKGLFTREYTVKNAVSNISFDIEEGEIVGYLGANGAGKSTTIKMMTGILTPSSGTISIDGIVPYEKREKNAMNIGVVFGQRTQLWWDIPLNETYTLLKNMYDIPEDAYRERFEFLDGVLGLHEFIMQPVRTLSLGQRMKADLAAALIHNPKVVFLDEPTIGLDVVVKEKVREAIREINRRYNTTFILTTHDLHDIEELSTRIIVIDKGVKCYDGSMENLKSQYGYLSTITVRIQDFAAVSEDAVKAVFDGMKHSSEFNVKKTEDSFVITFNKQFCTVSDIMQRLFASFSVADFVVQETGIEDIVKKIYLEAGER
ncbi:ATP-binding cassette domain-containing protein [Treponema porcinum]|uniref:ABC transporter ATP-binding protein n=1 Tax=Treponema porcinum TaxID=261392 RepID=UPI0023562FC5|nr:ATP-binding cassette domain-containing protein [Treponema porcinum]MCI5645173.1 ATP-binding cassette domain-containing protein [Treponema porcinum]MDY4467854.1 ATP-binding cassette domain-containing protein [Treponema porcinum]